jgi:hypothetical protein
VHILPVCCIHLFGCYENTDLILSDLNLVDSNYLVATFSKNTATGTLRKHLLTCHLDKWLDECKARNIVPTANAAKVVLQNRLQEVTEGDPHPIPRKPYSREVLLDAITEWIVADDIVCYITL